MPRAAAWNGAAAGTYAFLMLAVPYCRLSCSAPTSLSSVLDLHPVRWALVPLLLAAATAVGLLIDPYVSLTSQAMLYVLAVEVASYRLGRLEAAICAVGSVAALNFFFVPPRWTFAIDQREHLIALAVMLLVAFMTSRLAAGLQREARAARLSASLALAARSEAQRQELLSTFLASISHDLRTPLATILGAASSLQIQRDRLSPEQQSGMLASILTEARYLNTLTENTLQLARLSDPMAELHLDWESLEEIIGAALARVRPQDPGRRISSRVPSGLPLLRVDPVLLGQLLVNLLDNALKYSAGAIEIHAACARSAVDLCVSDRGPGIPSAQRESVFRPYSRGDRAGQRGAGLGLAVCRAIARAHGGQLAVEEPEGGGCRMRLSLPAEPQQPVGGPP